MIDKDLIKGCKNSSELYQRLIQHYGLESISAVGLQLQLLLVKLVLDREGLDLMSVLKETIVEIIPESNRFFILDSMLNDKPQNISLRGTEVAILELMMEDLESSAGKKPSMREVGLVLGERYQLPQRLRSKYVYDSKLPDIRSWADEMKFLVREHGMSIEFLIDNYKQHKK